MKFGLFYLFSDFGNVAQDRLLYEVLEEITYAEELGFESVWLPEHHFAIYGMLGNPLIFAASVAERTRRMKIGTAIMVVPFQHPLRLAEDAAMVDALSGGRLLLGLGRGYQPPEFTGFGLDQSTSREMFAEGFEIVRRALSGEKFTHQGKFWTFRDPVETLLLPATIVSLQVIRNSGTPRLRTYQKFSKYRRFITDAHILQQLRAVS